MDPLTFSEDVEQRRRMLPMSLAQSPGGTLSTTVQPGQALPMSLRARLAKVYDDMSKNEQEPDLSEWQAYAKQRGEEGQSSMLNALAAQYAGDSFQPVQAQFLKRAAASQEPMKLGNAMLTSDGRVIKDPYARADQRLAQLNREATMLHGMIDRQDQNEQARQDRLQRQSEISQLGWFNANTARMSANNASGNKAPAGYQWSTGPDGTPALTFIPGGPADPQTRINNGAPTEDERKAAGWFFQADLARRNMQAAVKSSPGASMPTVGERGLGMIPGVGEDLANAMRPEDRQKFIQAASSFAEATLRAATGAGVNRDEAMQKVRELTPQIGDRPGTIKQKIDAQQMYLESLRTRAGRAFPQGGPAQPSAAPVDDPLGLRR